MTRRARRRAGARRPVRAAAAHSRAASAPIAATPCFCVSYGSARERLAELRAKWSDCLCADCLAALAADPERTA